MKTHGKQRILSILAILTMAVLVASIFVACDILSQGSKQVPVYKGMTISRSYARTSAGTASDGEAYSESGRVEGDHEYRDNDFDQNKPFEDEKAPTIEEKAESTLDVVGAGKSIYYADRNQDVYITIKFSNPDGYEILSFTLNGKKYSNYMFEDGSDMENLILKVNVGYDGGIHDYTIDAIKYVDGTDIKDVRMEGDKTVKVGVRADDQTYAIVSNEQKSMTSISFDAKVIDSYSLIEMSEGYAKAVLYDGENMISKDIVVGEKNSVTFDNLTPNTVYQYGIVALYDDLSGNGVELNTLYKKAVYTDTIVLFKDVQVGQQTLTWGYDWNDGVQDKTITALTLWQKDEKVKDLDASITSLENLKTNNTYTLKATYKNLNNADESIEIDFTTLTKEIPGVALSTADITQTSASFVVNVTDEDSVGSIAKIELLHGEDEPVVLEDLTAREFTGLLSNNDYTVRVTYTYDLNDGVGEQEIVKITEFKTLAKAIPNVEIKNFTNTVSTIECDVVLTDEDKVGEITEIALYYGDTKVKTADVAKHMAFGELDNDTKYTVAVTCKYDLNDGKGERNLVVKADRYTSPVFELVEATCANTSAVSKGDIIYFEAVINNPSGVSVEKIKINDRYYTPSSGTTKNSIIVNITVEDQFEGGNTELKVSEIVGTLRDQEVKLALTSTNVANVFVNGELTVKSIAIVDEDGKEIDFVVKNQQYYYLVTLGNKTGYSIEEVVIDGKTFVNDSIVINDGIVIVDNNTIMIPNSLYNAESDIHTLSKITYSNQYLGSKSKDVVEVDCHVVCVNSAMPIVISTAEQLKDMDDWGYYVLGDDIDLAGTEWKDPGNFHGYFDGQGHTIKNMNFVGTVENADLYWGLFDQASGVIKNLTLQGRLIVTMNSTTTASTCDAYAGGICATSASILTLDNVGNRINLSVTNNVGGYVYVGGLIGCNNNAGIVTINNCCNKSAVTATSDNNYIYAGGLIGGNHICDTVTINNSYNEGAVTATGGSCFVQAGGLIGFSTSSGAVTINNSHNKGTVTATGDESVFAGGLIGSNYHMSTATINNSYNEGAVTATGDRYTRASGLVGYNQGDEYSTVTISDSYNTGAVTSIGGSYVYVGGLMGDNFACDPVIVSNSYNEGVVTLVGGSFVYAGGLVGSSINTVIINNSYNTSEVSTTSDDRTYVGGLIGYNYGASTVTISDSYNTGSVKATSDSDAVFVGGLVGYNYGTTIVVINSYNEGAVTATGGSAVCAGGLIGSNSSSRTAVINDSYNEGAVMATGDYSVYVGGLVGDGTSTINNSYYTLPNNDNQCGEYKESVAEIVEIMKDIWDHDVWDFDNLDENGNPTLKENTKQE